MGLSWPTIDEGKWNKIASGVLTGKIDRLLSNYRYYVTSVAKDATAPIDAIKDKSPILFEDSNQDEISNTTEIDVYVWPENSDTNTDDIGIINAIQVTV